MFKDNYISDQICSIDGHNDKVLGYCLYHLCQNQSAFCTYCLTLLDTHQQHRKWCIPFKEIEKKIPQAIKRFELEEQDFQYLSKQLIACKDLIEKNFNYKQHQLVKKLQIILTKVQYEHQNMEKQENLCKQLLEEPSQQYYESLKNNIIQIKQIFRNEKNYGLFQQISCLFKQKYDQSALRIQMNQINILNKNLALIYFNRGVSLGNKRQYRLAEAQFDKALLKDTQFAEAYVYKGYILHWRKDLKKAIQFYDQAIQLDQRNVCCFIAKGNPKYIDIFNYKANDLQKNKQYEKADQYYNFAQKLNPKYPKNKNFCFGNDNNPIRNFQAQQYIEKGTYSFLKAQAQGLERLKQYEGAIKCLDEGIKANPYEVQFYFQKADLQYKSQNNMIMQSNVLHSFLNLQAHRLKKRKQYEDAIKYFNDGIKVNPNEIQFYIQKAQLLEMLKQDSNAVKCYDDGIQANPNEIQLYFEKVQLLVKLEDNDNAVKCYDDGIKANPNEIQLYFEKVKLLVKLKDNDNAVKCFDDGIKSFPNEVKLYLKKADLLKTLVQLDNVIKCYDDGIKANPNEIELYLQKVDLLKSLYSSSKDFKCLDDEIKINPNKVQPCLQTAAPLNKEQQQNNATQFFDDAIAANYYDQFNIQHADLLVKQVKVTLVCIDDGLKANPNHILFYFEKVDFLIEIGLYTIASQLFEHITPPQNNVYFQLQKVYNLIKQEKYDDAFKCYNNEVKLNQNNYFFTAQQELLRNHSIIVKTHEIEYSENFETAIEQHNRDFVLEPFEKRYQIQVQTLSKQGEKLERQKQYSEAIQIFDQKMRMSKEKYFQDQEKKAQLLENLKNYKEALKCYRLVLLQTESQEILNKKQLIIKDI